MKYFSLLVIVAFLTICFVVMRTAAHSNRRSDKKHKEFLSRESEANSVRRADISGLDYVQIPLDKLPLASMESTDKPECVSTLESLAQEKIINLSMYTNTDLKMMYGPANLEELSACDERYTILIRLLDTMATALNDAGLQKDAMQILEYAVSIGSDITHTYTLLGTLYASFDDTDALNSLIRKSREITSLSGKTITSLLYSIKSTQK